MSNTTNSLFSGRKRHDNTSAEELLSKRIKLEAVTLANDQSIAGVKTFTDGILFDNGGGGGHTIASAGTTALNIDPAGGTAGVILTNGGYSAKNGTIASPSYTFNGNQTSGFHYEIGSPSALIGGVSGVEVMRVDSEGVKVNGNASMTTTTGSGIHIDVDDPTYPTISNRTSSSDVLQLSSLGSIDVVIDSNGGGTDSFEILSGAQNGAGDSLFLVTEERALQFNSVAGSGDYWKIDNGGRVSMYRTDATATSSLVNYYSDDGGTSTRQFTFRVDGEFEHRGVLTMISDKRKKKDIVDYDDTFLDAIGALQLKKFKFKNTDKERIGLLAQDVELAHPDLVGESTEFVEVDDDGNEYFAKTVNLTNLVMFLLGAVQELKKK